MRGTEQTMAINPQFLTDDILKKFARRDKCYQVEGVSAVQYTEGANHVAENGEAYWLLKEIALAQGAEKLVAAEPFQVWVLTVTVDCRATLSCFNRRANIVYRKDIEVTDFPRREITLWFADRTIYLPSER